MNKTELIEAIAVKAGITKVQAEQGLNGFMDVVEDALVKGEKITLTGFGTFSIQERAARVGRNPRTGDSIEIPAAKVPKFKPGKDLKEAVR